MSCNFCGVSTTTALYLECVRHKACDACFKCERRIDLGPTGKYCRLCLGEKSEAKIDRLGLKQFKTSTRKVPQQSFLKGNDYGSTTENPDFDDLNGCNEDIECLLSVLPPRGKENGIITILDEAEVTSEAPPGVSRKTSTGEATASLVEEDCTILRKRNVVCCPYPKQKVKRLIPLLTVQCIASEDESYEVRPCEPDQEVDCLNKVMKKEDRESAETLFSLSNKSCGNAESAVDSQVAFPGGDLENTVVPPVESKLFGVNIDNLLYHAPEWPADKCASSSSSSEDQLDSVFPTKQNIATPSRDPEWERGSLLLADRGLPGPCNWSQTASGVHRQSSCISISGDTDEDDLDLTDLDKKISIINLHATHAVGSRPRVSVRRLDRPAARSRTSKSEHTLGAIDEEEQFTCGGNEGSDHHLLLLNRFEPACEFARQQKGLLEEWARKEEIREDRQVKQVEQTTNEKKQDKHIPSEKSDGDRSPMKGLACEFPAVENYTSVPSDIPTQSMIVSPPDVSRDRCADEEASFIKSHMAARRAAMRQMDLRRFGCEGIPDPEDFWT